MDWQKVSEELRKPLDPSAIRPPPQGKYGEYVDGLHVIREANRIFGEEGWSYVITALDMCARTETQDRNGNPQVRIAYRCTVRSNVDGVEREGAAVGTGMAKPENEGDAHESAVKEAETDALKRSLRCFGNTFGLALYEKDKSKREVATPEPSAAPKPQKPLEGPELRDHMKNVIAGVKTLAALANVEANENFLTDLARLPEPMRNEITAYKDVRKNQLGHVDMPPGFEGRAA